MACLNTTTTLPLTSSEYSSLQVYCRKLDVRLWQDLFQETLCRLIMRAPERKESLLPWSKTVAKNLMVDSHRRRRADLIESFDSVPQLGRAPESILDNSRGFQRVLASAVKLLPEKQLAVFLMHGLLELEVSQIASITGLSQGNIRVQLHRSRAALRGGLPVREREIKALVSRVYGTFSFDVWVSQVFCGAKVGLLQTDVVGESWLVFSAVLRSLGGGESAVLVAVPNTPVPRPRRAIPRPPSIGKRLVQRLVELHTVISSMV